jgi:AcrR family transcriptional regulator
MTRWPARQEMQERILETADRLFYGQGIRAVGVDTIAAEIGISKRTLYNYYPSKDALIVAYLSRRSVPLEASDQPPAEQILGWFDRLECWAASGAFRGCPFVNAVAELGEANPTTTEIAIDFKEQRRLWLREALTRLAVADPDGLATQLAILVDGGVAAALVRGDPAMLRAAKAAARTLLTAAGVQTGTPHLSIPPPVIARSAATRQSPARRPRARRVASRHPKPFPPDTPTP